MTSRRSNRFRTGSSTRSAKRSSISDQSAKHAARVASRRARAASPRGRGDSRSFKWSADGTISQRTTIEKLQHAADTANQRQREAAAAARQVDGLHSPLHPVLHAWINDGHSENAQAYTSEQYGAREVHPHELGTHAPRSPQFVASHFRASSLTPTAAAGRDPSNPWESPVSSPERAMSPLMSPQR